MPLSSAELPDILKALDALRSVIEHADSSKRERLPEIHNQLLEAGLTVRKAICAKANPNTASEIFAGPITPGSQSLDYLRKADLPPRARLYLCDIWDRLVRLDWDSFVIDCERDEWLVRLDDAENRLGVRPTVAIEESIALTDEQLVVLRALRDAHPSASMLSDLETNTRITRKTIAAAVKQLTELGLAQRPPKTQRKGYAVTNKGLLVIEKANQVKPS